MKYKLFSLLFAATIATSCGDGDPSRMLLSIQVTPASADGSAQFTAIGTFSDGSKAQVAALWTLNPPFSLVPATPIPGNVSLSSKGLGQCTGFTGTAGIWATAPADPRLPLSKMTMSTKNVSGTAMLSCP